MCRPAGKEYFGEVAQEVGVPSFAQTADEPNSLYFAIVEPDTVRLHHMLTECKALKLLPAKCRNSCCRLQFCSNYNVLAMCRVAVLSLASAQEGSSAWCRPPQAMLLICSNKT